MSKTAIDLAREVDDFALSDFSMQKIKEQIEEWRNKCEPVHEKAGAMWALACLLWEHANAAKSRECAAVVKQDLITEFEPVDDVALFSIELLRDWLRCESYRLDDFKRISKRTDDFLTFVGNPPRNSEDSQRLASMLRSERDRKAASALLSVQERLEKAEELLRSIDEQVDNQNLNHVQFRVKCREFVHAFLTEQSQ